MSVYLWLFLARQFCRVQQVHVALKAGQGGTLLDLNLGAVANTWRVVEHAHAVGLVCAAVTTPPKNTEETGPVV